MQSISLNQTVYIGLNRFFTWLYSLFSSKIEILRLGTSDETLKDHASVHMSLDAGRLIDEYGNHILRLAYSYLHNMSDAEDILQETLLQLLKKQPMFKSSNHEKAWLLRVASNLSKNRIKYNKVRMTDELQDHLIAEHKEDLSFVWEVIRELPEKYRECIHLYYYEGYNTAQIAQLLKQKESSIRSKLHRGREQLKVLLKEGYDFE